MPIRRLAAALSFPLLLTLPSVTFAWGPEGHQVVALIAYAHLTPEAKAGTKALLGDGKDIYDAEICDWADVIRQAHKEVGPYHYVDADVNLRSIDLQRDGADGKNVVDGILDQTAILLGKTGGRQIVLADSDETNSDKPAETPTDKPTSQTETREQALRWLVHLVGDVEQPLHCCDRNQDQGGNKVKVQFEDVENPTNLHSVWDGWMLRVYVNDYFASHQANSGGHKETDNGKTVPDITDYAMSLDAKITSQQAQTVGRRDAARLGERVARDRGPLHLR